MAKKPQIVTVTLDESELARIRENVVAESQAKAVSSFKTSIGQIAKSAAERTIAGMEKAQRKATARVNGLIDSQNEEIAFKSSTYVLDHLIGKATQKTFNRTETVHIDVLAD